MNRLLSLPAFIFGRLAWLRGRLYDLQWLKIQKVRCPVVSVGNITVGGTGKTPFSIWLLDRLLAQGFKPAFVSRGYKSDGVAPRAVTQPDAKLFGDEPSQVRERFHTLPVYIGADRSEVIEYLLSHHSVDLVIADDAFQHRKLSRDLDFVLLDPLEPQWHYDYLPKGRAREGFGAVNRAQFVVLTKMNLADPSQIQFLNGHLADFKGHRLFVSYRNAGLRQGNTHKSKLEGSFFLVTGVGRPESVKTLLGSQVTQHKIFPDHHVYTNNDVRDILLAFKQSEATHLVTTVKDAVKLRSFPDMASKLWELELAIDVEGDLNELDRQIRRLVRPRA
jgi:tetraacyldisaccharide 4'-kinase